MRELIGILVAALFGGSAFAEPTVRDLKVTAIPPWGLALDYTVEGATAADNNLMLDVMATDGTKTYYAESLIGATNRANGAHRVYWNMAADGLTATATNSTVMVSYRPLYCIIDLSAGANATSYPVSYLSAAPKGGWTDEYKTDKIVLRRIDGTNGVYYAGVFEITKAQWDRVMGGSSTGTTPKDYVSYGNIRGDEGTYNWPDSDIVDPTSFMGLLRQKTGLATLDLPSDEEWEYAARAGVTTKWLCGDSETGLDDYAWYSANSDGGTHAVGTRRANAWGIYDVHGNVWEWCLNRCENHAYYRSLRGGAHDSGASDCALASRHGYGSGTWSTGFRLFCRPGSN